MDDDEVMQWLEDDERDYYKAKCALRPSGIEMCSVQHLRALAETRKALHEMSLIAVGLRQRRERIETNPVVEDIVQRLDRLMASPVLHAQQRMPRPRR